MLGIAKCISFCKVLLTIQDLLTNHATHFEHITSAIRNVQIIKKLQPRGMKIHLARSSCVSSVLGHNDADTEMVNLNI